MSFDGAGNIRRVYAWKCLSSMHFFSAVLIPFFTEWGGITLSQVFWLQTWFVVASGLFEAPTGAVADRWGRKASLVLSSVFLIAAVAVYVSRPGFYVFLVAETLWALALSLGSGAEEAMVYDSLKAEGGERESKKALTRLGSCEVGAIAVAAPLGGLIAHHCGLRAPLTAQLLPFALGLLAALSLREPPVETESKREGYWAILSQGLRYFAGHPALRALAFDSITVGSISFMVIWLYQPRLKELGVPLAVFGFVAGVSTLLQILLLARIKDVEALCGGARRYLAVSALIPGLALVALAFAGSPWLAIPLIVLVPGVGMSRTVVISSHMNKHIESRNRATVLSSASMARRLFTGALYPLVGWAAERSLSWTFFGLGAAILLAYAASSVREEHLALD